jgi:hypothetical protein
MTLVVAVTPDPVMAFEAIVAARAAYAGDSAPVLRSTRAEGDVPPFALIRDAGERLERNAPVLNPARVSVSQWELTSAAAARRLRRISALVHGFGPTEVALATEDGGTVVVFKVFNETGVQPPVQDPETRWWVATAAFDLYMTDRAVE